MLPPRQRDTVCCEQHIRRYMPIPETFGELQAVAEALAEWDRSFWEQPDREQVPLAVLALCPPGFSNTQHVAWAAGDRITCACPAGVDHDFGPP